MRGTLRYSGFSLVMNGFKEIGLFENDTDCGDSTWYDLLCRLVSEKPSEESHQLDSIVAKMVEK